MKIALTFITLLLAGCQTPANNPASINAGLSYQQIQNGLHKSYRYFDDGNNIYYVTNVEPGGYADRLGMKAGYLIHSISPVGATDLSSYQGKIHAREDIAGDSYWRVIEYTKDSIYRLPRVAREAGVTAYSYDNMALFVASPAYILIDAVVPESFAARNGISVGDIMVQIWSLDTAPRNDVVIAQQPESANRNLVLIYDREQNLLRFYRFRDELLAVGISKITMIKP